MSSDDIGQALVNLASCSPARTQIRFHRRKTLSISAENGVLREATSTTHAGVFIRVRTGGVWGCASTADLSPRSLERAFSEALSGSRVATRVKPHAPPFSERPAAGEFSVRQTRPFSEVPIEEKIALVRQAEAAVRASHSKIASSSASYTEWCDEKVIVSSAGAHAIFRDAKADFRVTAVACDGSERESSSVRTGCTGGWKELFRHHRPEEMPEEAARNAVEKLRAEVPQGGMATVILHPTVVGLLAHEAIGHTVEADFVLAGSIVKDRLGQKVAAETLTLVDDHLPEADTAASGVILVDDEGTRPEKVVIIKNGILANYLHDTETAAHFGVPPTGNSRAFTYQDEPLIRMRNTYILPGGCPVEEMIANTRDGIYCKNLGLSGQADANAEFMFDVAEAWKIEDGKLCRRLRGVTIAGQAFEVLSSVDCVGSDFLLDTGAGFCGKHQLAKVDGGGPHLRCRMKIGGRL